MITLSEIAMQLNLDQDELTKAETDHLESITAAAKAAVFRAINRPIYATKDELKADENAPRHAIVMTDDIKHAVLLMVGHLYANREATTTEAVKQLPLGMHFLISPYVWVEI
ncbi:head-tail connector protein [Salinivibrio socompensis]|uniref:head-tail connector protein n=1 Tax=Salinivibrio socompensis TaxID=1510206 RepID=UPI0004719E1C|nr:head-tail connector protein [Salinivibrio socompensis]